ncbi:MAG: hypothetical protein MPK03_06385, partial [Alphaproteobacteria bacterium]|nr:hypothetical protein [Alphaproteobacteria bacterium]
MTAKLLRTLTPALTLTAALTLTLAAALTLTLTAAASLSLLAAAGALSSLAVVVAASPAARPLPTWSVSADVALCVRAADLTPDLPLPAVVPRA